MGITSAVQTIISCDDCGEVYVDEFPQKKTIKLARKSGWSIGKKVLCPDCKKKS